MDGTWVFYSGAVMLLLSLVAVMVVGRPVIPAYRDRAAIISGFAVFSIVCILGLILGGEAIITISGSCLWFSAGATGVNAFSGRR